MTKKILASILAAASILSVSATAFAAELGEDEMAYDSTKADGATYSVSATVSYGTVDVTVPKTLDGVIINPYGAAVKTTVGSDAIANKGAVASKIYTITNNDDTDGIKVMATTAVTKASGVVIVDGNATEPTGWSDALDSKTEKPLGNKDWNPLVTYDKLSSKTDRDSGAVTYYGGAKSAKQTKNVALNLVGNNAADKLFAKGGGLSTDKNLKTVPFAAKGNTTGELGSCAASEAVYFTVFGELNPELPADTEWSTAKDTLTLSVVLKILPVVAD